MVIEPGSNGINTSSGASKTRQGSAGAAKNEPSLEGNPTGKAQDNKASGSDSVVLSDTAKSLAQIEASLAKATEVNLEKVEQVRDQLNAGNYAIDTDLIASRMLEQDDLL